MSVLDQTQTQGTLYGYARVSTDEQELALQLDALQQAGCDESNIFGTVHIRVPFV